MNNEFLRHTLATIGYRFAKSVKGSSSGFGDFSLGKGSRSPREIIHHMYQVLNWTRIFIEKEKLERASAEELDLTGEIERFHAELKLVDAALADQELPIEYAKKLLQGPLSDILTHVGQISMLQRLDDNPIKGEDFSAAEIK